MNRNFIYIIFIYLIAQTTIATTCVKTNNPQNFYEKYCEEEPAPPKQEIQPNFKPNINPTGPIKPNNNQQPSLPARQSNPGYELPKPFEPPHFNPQTTSNAKQQTQPKITPPTNQPTQKQQKQPKINWEWMN